MCLGRNPTMAVNTQTKHQTKRQTQRLARPALGCSVWAGGGWRWRIGSLMPPFTPCASDALPMSLAPLPCLKSVLRTHKATWVANCDA